MTQHGDERSLFVDRFTRVATATGGEPDTR